MVVPQRALVLDDNEVVVQLILDVAWRLDIACNGTTDPELFFEMVAPEVTLIFIDISMPQLDGIQVLRRLGEMRCKAGIVLISGMEHRTVEIAQELAVGFGLLVKDPLPKPFRIAELEKRLKTIVHREATTSASPPDEVARDDCETHEPGNEEGFRLSYQPQVHLATGKVTGVEVRVRTMRTGMPAADSFSESQHSSDAEETAWLILDHAMADAGVFVDSGGVRPRLSIQVSTRSLGDLSFPERLLAIASARNFALERLTLEIEDGDSPVHSFTQSMDVLVRLRARRINISISDGLLGSKMFERFKRVPATELRIGRNLMVELGRSVSARIITEKLIESGHGLKLSVLADGIETAEQLEFVRGWRCDCAQGSIFSEPLAPTAFADWLLRYGVPA